ncbi:GNAT family protein [Nocardioides lentus]|uniref:GNAT family protein n=1 Tax=Nocardioides lentus TaxID=338077 RepID=A0ABP5AVP9_9ACTN
MGLPRDGAPWPARLVDGELVLRPLTYGDAGAWREVRARNRDWLRRWDATLPPGVAPGPRSFRGLVWRMKRIAAAGQGLPFAIEVDGRFVGQVTVSSIVRGSAQMANLGYWIDEAVAGRGLMPRAVALVLDHCLTAAALHRVEIAIRPENSNSLRVVEKLGLTEVGFAPRFLHIDGEWRDHRLFAITAEERDRPVRDRLR